MINLDDIQTAQKPLKQSEKIEINSYNPFSTSWTVTLFDDLFLEKYKI